MVLVRDKTKKNKKLLFVLILEALTLFSSCLEEEQTHTQQTKKTVKTYLDNLLKDEPITGYKIDSLIINNITENKKIEKEAFKYRELATKSLTKAKELGKEYQDLKELQSLATGLDTSKELNTLKQEF